MKMGLKPLHLWRVKYCTAFSSSDMDNHPLCRKDLEGFVYTEGDSLADVERAIQSSLSIQCRLTKLSEATFMGFLLNE
jgi:hypothetical protein